MFAKPLLVLFRFLTFKILEMGCKSSFKRKESFMNDSSRGRERNLMKKLTTGHPNLPKKMSGN
jgi:hypothetical protein